MAEQAEVSEDKQDEMEPFPGISWVNSWWQSAKEKSSSALEFMKKDLTEFSQVVKEDTVSAISTTSALVKEKLNVDSDESVAGRARIGLTTLVHSVSGAFYPINELQENEVLMIHNSQPVRLENWETELFKIKTEFGTFCHEPDGPPELYEKWLESFRLEKHNDEISQIMVDNPETRQIYSKLVPAAISNVEFWQRYFYRVHQLKEKEARRAELVKRVDIEKIDDLAWEDDDESTQCHKEKEFTSPSIITSPKSFSSKSPEINVISTKNQSEPENLLVNVANNSERIPSNEYLNLGDLTQKQTTSSNTSLAASNSSDKEGTTGDEWEKDFEAEIRDFIPKDCEIFVEEPKIQQDEDWEKWE